MVAALCEPTVPVPPPAYHRAQAKRPAALHLDALTLVRRLPLLALCRVAVRLAQQRCRPQLSAGPGGRPRCYRDESLVLLALVRTLWRLSYQDLHDWLVAWPALAFGVCLWAARRRPRSPVRAQRFPAMPAGGAGGRSALRDAVGRVRSARKAPAPHRRARPHHR